MRTFNSAKDLFNHLRKAAAEQQKEVIVTSQAWLGSARNSPRDSGRLRSSWFAAEGSSSGEVAPEGADAANTDAQGLTADLDREYYLTNNLPYAAPIALGIQLPPSWGGEHRVVSAPKDWFISFRNEEIPKIADAAGRVIKRRFDL